VGKIEVALDLSDGEPRGIALVAHPHPLFGGSMDNKVARTLVQLKYVTYWSNVAFADAVVMLAFSRTDAAKVRVVARRREAARRRSRDRAHGVRRHRGEPQGSCAGAGHDARDSRRNRRYRADPEDDVAALRRQIQCLALPLVSAASIDRALGMLLAQPTPLEANQIAYRRCESTGYAARDQIIERAAERYVLTPALM
jgi:hypothetical protein